MDDPRTVADCLVNQHDGGASAGQLALALGWPPGRLNAALAWLVERDLVSVTTADDPDWPFLYLRQNARTESLLRNL